MVRPKPSSKVLTRSHVAHAAKAKVDDLSSDRAKGKKIASDGEAATEVEDAEDEPSEEGVDDEADNDYVMSEEQVTENEVDLEDTSEDGSQESDRKPKAVNRTDTSKRKKETVHVLKGKKVAQRSEGTTSKKKSQKSRKYYDSSISSDNRKRHRRKHSSDQRHRKRSRRNRRYEESSSSDSLSSSSSSCVDSDDRSSYKRKRKKSHSRKKRKYSHDDVTECSASEHFRPFAVKYISRISKSFDALDYKLWKCGLSSSHRHQRLIAMSSKVIGFMDAERGMIVPPGQRKNYSWDEMFQKWCTYAKRHPDRRNRIPLKLTRLSGWVHQQRKNFKNGVLAEELVSKLENEQFEFAPRSTAAINKSSSSKRKGPVRRVSKQGVRHVTKSDSRVSKAAVLKPQHDTLEPQSTTLISSSAAVSKESECNSAAVDSEPSEAAPISAPSDSGDQEVSGTKFDEPITESAVTKPQLETLEPQSTAFDDPSAAVSKEGEGNYGVIESEHSQASPISAPFDDRDQEVFGTKCDEPITESAVTKPQLETLEPQCTAFDDPSSAVSKEAEGNYGVIESEPSQASPITAPFDDGDQEVFGTKSDSRVSKAAVLNPQHDTLEPQSSTLISSSAAVSKESECNSAAVDSEPSEAAPISAPSDSCYKEGSFTKCDPPVSESSVKKPQLETLEPQSTTLDYSSAAVSKEAEGNCGVVESVPSEAAPISTPSAIQEVSSIDCSQITEVTVLDPQSEKLSPISKPPSAVARSRLRKKLEIFQNTSPDKDNVMRSRLRKRKVKTIPMNNPTVDGPKKKEVAKTTSQSTAEKKGTVSHPIVINDNEIPPNSDANSHLFKFKKKHSGEEMLKHILECKYVSRSSRLNGKIAFYAFSDGITRSHEILYSDFTRFVNKDWVSDNVVNAFFKRMDLEYGHKADKNSRFGTSFMWDSYIDNEYYPLSKLRSKLAMGNIYDSLDDLYLPILVLQNHWILAVVNFTDKRIDIYDSMDSQHGHIVKTMVQRFQPMFRDQNVWIVNDHYLDVSVQRQSDLYSCGYYVCWYAYKLVSQGSVGVWSDITIEDISRKIFLCLIEGKIIM
jgi:hypothetical protein